MTSEEKLQLRTIIHGSGFFDVLLEIQLLLEGKQRELYDIGDQKKSVGFTRALQKVSEAKNFVAGIE